MRTRAISKTGWTNPTQPNRNWHSKAGWIPPASIPHSFWNLEF
jgi:hypothetical protein